MSEISLRANRLAVEFEAFTQRAGDETIDRWEEEAPIGTVEHVLTRAMLEEAAALLRERGEGLTVRGEQISDLRHALGSLPYSGLMPARPDVTDLEDVIVWLQGFAGVLHGIAERAQESERELHMIRTQRAAIRDFLGIRQVQEDVGMLFENAELDEIESTGDDS